MNCLTSGIQGGKKEGEKVCYYSLRSTIFAFSWCLQGCGSRTITITITITTTITTTITITMMAHVMTMISPARVVPVSASHGSVTTLTIVGTWQMKRTVQVSTANTRATYKTGGTEYIWQQVLLLLITMMTITSTIMLMTTIMTMRQRRGIGDSRKSMRERAHGKMYIPLFVFSGICDFTCGKWQMSTYKLYLWWETWLLFKGRWTELQFSVNYFQDTLIKCAVLIRLTCCACLLVNCSSLKLLVLHGCCCWYQLL